MGLVVVLTTVTLILTAAAYLVTVALLPASTLHEKTNETHRQ